MKKTLLLLIAVSLVPLIVVLLYLSQKGVPLQLTSNNTNQPSTCPEPFVFKMPIDLNRVTSILYPGQIRGNSFKAHGGFRFDGSRPDQIAVRVPYDAKVVAGARYPVNGEVQYTFDFEHPCGIRYRFGHLLTLTPKFQAIADKFPLPSTLDSRTTQVVPPIDAREGEIVATAVGLTKGGPETYGGYNTFVDWGVYDYRQKNEASQRPGWRTLHESEDPTWSTYYNSDTNTYAVCWFDWISAEDRRKVLDLPSADGEHGKESDFCN
jgi:hypothetical protein